MKYLLCFLPLFYCGCSTPELFEDKVENNTSSRYYDYVHAKIDKIEHSQPVLTCVQAERNRIGENIPESRFIKVHYAIEMSGYIEEEYVRVVAEFPITNQFEKCLKDILTKLVFESPYDLKPFEGVLELDINPSQEKL